MANNESLPVTKTQLEKDFKVIATFAHEYLNGKCFVYYTDGRNDNSIGIKCLDYSETIKYLY